MYFRFTAYLPTYLPVYGTAQHGSCSVHTYMTTYIPVWKYHTSRFSFQRIVYTYVHFNLVLSTYLPT